MSTRRPVIGVMGGGHATDIECALAEDLGQLIARAGWILLCGGRPAGVMDAAARGAHLAGGLVVGILPGRRDDPAEVSEHLDIAIITGMGDARNAINVLSSNVVVACPGGPGTVSEVALALKCGRPVVLLGWDEPTRVFPAYLESGAVRVAATASEARDLAAALLAQRKT
ncbi:MAG TPA: LOG family protein [Ktedonobacterales bacterium]